MAALLRRRSESLHGRFQRRWPGCGRTAFRPSPRRNADVVQADVAEAALLPPAAVGHRQLVPEAVAPQAMHGVRPVRRALVAVQRQAVRAHYFGFVACKPRCSSPSGRRMAPQSRRMGGDLRASPPGAAEPGQAAQARVRPRPGALPELRRRAEDPCGHVGAAGDREGPHAPGVAGGGATTLSCSRSSAASGLTIPIHHRSGGPARWAAGVGCVRVVAGPMVAANRRGATRRSRPGRRFSAGLSTPNGFPPASKERSKRIGRRVLPCSACQGGRKRAFKNPILGRSGGAVPARRDSARR